jgi:hypothetical protein
MNQIVVAVVEITVLIIPIIIVVDVVDAEEDNINKKVDNKWQIIMLPFNIRFYYCIEKIYNEARLY